MFYGFVKSFSFLLAKCLGIDINNINLNEYIKEYSKNIKINLKKKGIESKTYYKEKIKEIKEEIEKYLIENKNNNNIINFNPIQYEKDTSDINIIIIMFIIHQI